MTDSLGRDFLAQASELVASATGWHYPPERWPEFERGLTVAAAEFGFDDVAGCVGWLSREGLTQERVEVLARHLTVGETYFYRERAAFDALERHVLPQLIPERRSRDRRLRVWSAGCCTGEEPYTLAVALTRALPDLEEWSVTLLATDINPAFLRRAATGVFGQWSFRGAPPEFRDRYFTNVAPGIYEILPELRRMVTFAYLNLAEQGYPSLLNNTNAMDVIFCRNVLIYLGGDHAGRVLRGLTNCLTDEGRLVLGAVEAFYGRQSGLEADTGAGTAVFRKTANGKGAGGHAPTEPTAAPISEPESRRARAAGGKVVSGLRPGSGSHQPPAEGGSSRAPKESARSAADMAAAMIDEGRFAEAIDLLSSLPLTERDSPPTLLLLSRACADLGRLHESLAWCDRALALRKVDADVHYLRAAILQELGDGRNAAQALRRALYLEPDFVMACVGLGNVARAAGHEREAERHFANARRLLGGVAPGDVVPQSGGMTAGRLAEMLAGSGATPSSAGGEVGS